VKIYQFAFRHGQVCVKAPYPFNVAQEAKQPLFSLSVIVTASHPSGNAHVEKHFWREIIDLVGKSVQTFTSF
jgi:hypothetical protein